MDVAPVTLEGRHIRLEPLSLAHVAGLCAVGFDDTEAKLLMLQHAFEAWGCIRVELKTDSLNAKSRNAIMRLRAKEEGIFRNHFITHSGRIRHSVFFSILDRDWLTVEANLKAKLERA
jgi:hypothetical protein